MPSGMPASGGRSPLPRALSAASAAASASSGVSTVKAFSVRAAATARVERFGHLARAEIAAAKAVAQLGDGLGR